MTLWHWADWKCKKYPIGAVNTASQLVLDVLVLLSFILNINLTMLKDAPEGLRKRRVAPVVVVHCYVGGPLLPNKQDGPPQKLLRNELATELQGNLTFWGDRPWHLPLVAQYPHSGRAMQDLGFRTCLLRNFWNHLWDFQLLLNHVFSGTISALWDIIWRTRKSFPSKPKNVKNIGESEFDGQPKTFPPGGHLQRQIRLGACRILMGGI